MVLFVVGIMASLTVMAVGGNTARQLRHDAARLQQVLGMAQNEASFSGQELGLSIARDEKSYSFLTFDDVKLEWQPLQKEAFSQQSLPEDIQLELEMSGARVDLVKIYKDALGKTEQLDNWLTAGDKPSKTKSVPPVLIFFSDGHYTPFRLQVSSSRVKGRAYVITGDGLGSVRMQEADSKERRSSAKRKTVND